MKKSRLSLAAITALGITTASLSANSLIDIKLTDDTWKFIGVNGPFAYSGTGTTSEIEETVDDNSFTYDGTFTNTGLMVIDHNDSSEPTEATMTIYTDGHTYAATAMPPEMYGYFDSSSTPDIRIKYQSDFEGESFLIETEDGTFAGTFDSAATSATPQLIADSSLSETSIGLELDDIFDRNLSNNPSSAGQTGAKNTYVVSDNQDAISATTSKDDNLSIYNYNAISKKWDIYKDGGSNNDFSALEAGKGYWVKYQHSDDLNETGLILGAAGISTSTYSSSNLSDGWNMLAFNDSNIRSGATGLELTFATAQDQNFTISDSEGTDSIDINTSSEVTTGASGMALIASIINRKIAGAIKRGEISSNFNVRAYPTSADAGLTIALISDRKFRIFDYTDDTARGIALVRTLGGNNPYDLNTSSLSRIAMPHLKTAGVESVYGEYALATKLNSTTSFGTINKGKVRINDNTPLESNSSLTNYVTALGGILEDTDIDATLQIDTDFDGTLDTALLINNDENFYIRDNTWTKMYKNENNTSDGEDIVIDVNQSDNYVTIAITGITDNNASSIGKKGIAALLNSGFSSVVTDVNITGDTTTQYIYLSTNNENYKDLALEEIAGDTRFVEVFNSTEDNASGAITDVYSLENLAQATVQDTIAKITIATLATGNIIEFNLTNSATPGDEFNISIYNNGSGVGGLTNIKTYAIGTYNGIAIGGNDLNISGNAAIATATDFNITYNATASGNVTTVAKVSALAAYAINYIFEQKNYPAVATYSSTNIYITGENNITSRVATNDALSITQVGGNLTITPITTNLGYNPVYASEHTTSESPVQTLTTAGYKVSKILTTNEDTSGNISWNFIDLTKDADEWFNEEDQYSLFSFDKEKGYWVYLTGNETNELSEFASLTPTLTTTWSHKFNNDVNNSTSSNDLLVTNAISDSIISVDTSTMTTGTIDRVVADVDGNEIRLTKSGNSYTSSFSSYDLDSLSSSDINITISAFDTTGHMATTSIVLDNTAPTTPTVTFSDNGRYLILDSASTDASQNYIYSGDINDSSPMSDGTFEGNISDGAPAKNLCSLADNFSSNLGAFKFVSVDGTGDMDYSRVSTIGYLGSDATVTFYPIYKNGSILVTNDTTSYDANASEYNSSCESSGYSVETGVAITNIDDVNISIAYENNGSNSLADVAIAQIDEVTLSIDSVDVAKIQFDNINYINGGQKILIQYNNTMYYTNWKVLNDDADSAVDLTDDNLTDPISGMTIAD